MAKRIGLSLGDGSMTYSEIQSWIELSKVELTMREIETIHYLSAIFVNARYELKDEEAPVPWMPESRRAALDEQMEAYKKFNALIQKGNA